MESAPARTLTKGGTLDDEAVISVHFGVFMVTNRKEATERLRGFVCLVFPDVLIEMVILYG